MSNLWGSCLLCLVGGALLGGCGRPERGALAEQERREQVELLLRKALDQLALHHYDQAERTIEEVLDKAPGNDEALKLRELTTEARHQQAQGDVYHRGRPEDEPRSRLRRGGPRPSADVVEALRLMDEQRHVEAEACLQRALALEPGSVEILGLLSRVQALAATERAREDMADVGATYLTRMFPDKEHWARVRRRHGRLDTDSGAPDWIRDYREMLRSLRVTLNFPDTPFAEVIAFLQDVSGLNIVVSPAVDQEEITVSLRLREIPLRDALLIILEQTQLVMAFEDEALCIGLPASCSGDLEPYDLEIYDVQDLVRWVGERHEPRTGEPREGVLEPDQLELIVTRGSGGDVWDAPASIELHRGQLIVNQTRAGHRQLRDVLQELRQR